MCRCREKQRKEASRLQTVNRKLTAMNKLLMEENDRLQKQVSHLVYENGYMKQQIHTVSLSSLYFVNAFCVFFNIIMIQPCFGLNFEQASAGTTTDNSCESVVMSGQNQQQNPTPQHPNRDANNPAG